MAIRKLRVGHVLETERLILRPFHGDDVDEVIAAIDDNVRLWQGFPEDEQALLDYMRSSHPGFRRDPLNEQWVIVEKESARIIGERTIYSRTDDGPRCFTGSWLTAGKRGIGLGSEELRAVMELVAGHPGVRYLVAGTMVSNERALGFYRKHGFSEHAVQPFRLPNGRVEEAVWMMRELKSDDLI